MGEKLKAGEAMKEGNKRFNARRASARRAKALREAEERAVVADRELHQRLKQECRERNPHWFQEAA